MPLWHAQGQCQLYVYLSGNGYVEDRRDHTVELV
jgi:hypothetical protein